MPRHTQILHGGVKVQHNIHPYKLVALGAGISAGTGLVNNVINQKYIAPKYSKSERYYTTKLHNGTVVSSTKPITIRERGGTK